MLQIGRRVKMIRQNRKRLSPLDIEIRHFELFMPAFELRMEFFVMRLLPCFARGIAEKDPAAEGADRVNRAKAIDLEWARRIGSAGLQPGQIMKKRRQLEGRHKQPMSIFLEPAASPGGGA